MRGLRLTLLLSVLILLFSCDTTNSSFDETLPEVYSLQTNSVPQGLGVVAVNPIGSSFEANERIVVEAIPSEGNVFERWDGALTGNRNPETIIMDGDKSITAHFIPRDYPLNISISGEGQVIEAIESRSKIESSNQASGINIKAGSLTKTSDSLSTSITSTSDESVLNDQSTKTTTVELSAEPAEGWYFSQWEGDLTGNVNPEVITVDEEKNVTAVFLQEESDGFTININVIGEGEVNKNPDRTFFNEGDNVTLTASADQGWSFVEWQGDLSGTQNSQSVTIEGDLDITALFEVSEDPGLIITEQPRGTVAGVRLSPSPKVRMVDGLGEPMQGQNITVSLSDNSFTEESILTAATNDDGIASFENLVIETALSDYVLTFSANEPDVADISSNPFGVTAAEGDASNSSATVPNGVAGMETVISITVLDRFGNGVSGVANDLTVDIGGVNSNEMADIEAGSPGEYTATYTPESIGADQISIQLEGVAIPGSPFTSNIVTSGGDRRNSSATVPDGVAGELTVIEILVNDRFGNVVGGVAGELSVEVTGVNSASPEVSDGDTEGTYIASYTPENAGRDQVSIELRGASIEGSPYNSDITPAAADPANSSATVPDGVSGMETEIMIIVVDRFGNSIEGAADDLSVTVTGSNSATPTIRETNTSGEYTARYVPVRAGSDQVSIELDGESIAGSPFESNIEATNADPSNSVANVPDGVAGEETVVTITARDQFGNPVNNLEGVITVGVSGANNANLSVTVGESPGEYLASYTPEVSGVDQVAIQIEDEAIAGSPFTSNISASAGDVSNSSATVPNGVAGEETEIVIVVQDRFGNDVLNASNSITIGITGANNSSPRVTTTEKPGQYSAVYIPENAGRDQVSIMLDGDSIEGSPFRSNVVAAEADASSSTANVPNGVAGEETTISISVSDRFGNPVTNVLDDLSAEVSGANSRSLTINEGISPGQYSARYMPEKSGEDAVAILLGDTPINGSPFSSSVTAAGVDASNSELSAEPDELVVGQISIVTVEVRDRFSNPVLGLSDADFVVSLDGEASAGAVTPASGDGEFQFEVTSTKAGDVEVSVSVNGVGLDDSETIEFEPGVPDEIIIVTQPENSQSGQKIAGPPAVRIIDEFGNPVPGVDVMVREEGGAEFFDSDLTERTSGSGVATFDNLVLNRFFGNFRLVFSVEGVQSVNSDRFLVSPFISDD